MITIIVPRFNSAPCSPLRLPNKHGSISPRTADALSAKHRLWNQTRHQP